MSEKISDRMRIDAVAHRFYHFSKMTKKEKLKQLASTFLSMQDAALEAKTYIELCEQARDVDTKIESDVVDMYFSNFEQALQSFGFDLTKSEQN